MSKDELHMFKIHVIGMHCLRLARMYTGNVWLAHKFLDILGDSNCLEYKTIFTFQRADLNLCLRDQL